MGLKRKIWRKVRRVLPVIGEAFAAPSVKQALIDQEIRALKADLLARTPQNPALHGFKVYSQVDEDGIIEGDADRALFWLNTSNGASSKTPLFSV